MNKQQAYNSFWGQFGVLAFEENSVPDDETIQSMIDSGLAESKFPYITYQVLTDDYTNIIVPSASIWDRSTSWEKVDLLANKIAKTITEMNIIKLDDGRMFITKGSPFSQHMSGDGDSVIKRNVLSIGVQFLTEY